MFTKSYSLLIYTFKIWYILSFFLQIMLSSVDSYTLICKKIVLSHDISINFNLWTKYLTSPQNSRSIFLHDPPKEAVFSTQQNSLACNYSVHGLF